ncbi:DUF397 domain-containing protein [Actinocrispum wychmicini]|uniref:Uncharacterized protein DUF397 n=1 Tax=Actinocrispum wychmicini TaxID=1213861 RepID=A0A4V2S2T0_9PSEU|nr:DUF397 domain-containing protein [Actinocrispum wychmicini]TCO41650.1 uncharacterized protein DUF397 [Actinocrispum wychmicini]
MVPPDLDWRKSSFSGGEGGNCVELALDPDDSRRCFVRDSKNPDGPVLHLNLRPLQSVTNHPNQ